MRKLLIILLSLSICNFANAQLSLFEFTYHFEKDKHDFKAFILRNEDGTGFIRVRFIDEAGDNKPALVDMDLYEHYDTLEDGKPDTNLLVVEGRNARIIVGDKNMVYGQDFFLFERYSNTDEFDPLGALAYESVDNSFTKSNKFEQRLLQKQDLTPEFVLQYFLKNEDLYVNLFETTTRGITQEEKETGLHLVVVANTNDAKIGKTCVIDKDNTINFFKEIAEYLEMKFDPKEISGNNFSKVNVDKAISDINPSKNDIVVFYYTGHGYGDMKDGFLFPHIDLRDKRSQSPGDPYQLSMDDIYKSIKAKGARLNLVISDCCNSEIGKAPSLSTNIASTRVSSIGWSKNNCISLFLNPKPFSALLTAASKGQESAGNTNDGGFFTFNLNETLEKFMGPVYKNVGWNQIIQNAQTQTIEKANKSLCPQIDGTIKDCKQTPLFKEN